MLLFLQWKLCKFNSSISTKFQMQIILRVCSSRNGRIGSFIHGGFLCWSILQKCTGGTLFSAKNNFDENDRIWVFFVLKVSKNFWSMDSRKKISLSIMAPEYRRQFVPYYLTVPPFSTAFFSCKTYADILISKRCIS